MKKINLADINYTTDLQTSLAEFYKTYGSQFIIYDESTNISIPLELTESSLPTFKMKFYTLIYDVEGRDFELYPLKINFIDMYKIKLNDTVYISNIHKTNELTGSQIVKFALELLKRLGTKKVYIYDGTTVKCSSNSMDYDLSFLKLLEKGKTFYMNFGFDFDNVGQHYSKGFTSPAQYKQHVKKTIAVCKKIKVKQIVSEYKKILHMCYLVIKSGDYENFKVRCREGYTSLLKYKKRNTWICKKNITDLVYEAKEMLDVLGKAQNKYLYDFMIQLFSSSECSDYDVIIKNMLDNQMYLIEYNGTKISREYFESFFMLRFLRYNIYTYKFD
jgi:hypothetical protein